LGCFFWGYVMTELPGGRMAEIFGARKIFGYSMLIASLMTLLTPLAANISHYAVVALRVIIGFTLVKINLKNFFFIKSCGLGCNLACNSANGVQVDSPHGPQQVHCQHDG
jgi:MFS family permease